MKHYLHVIIILTVLLTGCSEDDKNNTGENQTVEFSNEGAIQGIIYKNGEAVNLNGNYNIDNNQFEIFSVQGTLSGPITVTDNGYNIIFQSGTGLYEDDAEGLTGTIVLTGSEIETLTFDSQYINGGADLMSFTYLQSLNLQKSVVYFAHDLVGRTASITLEDQEGQRFDFLGNYYEPTDDNTPGTYDFCHMEDAGFRLNSDNMTTFFPIWSTNWPYDEDNPYVPVVGFVVDKETHINYTIHWDNGYEEHGNFYSDIGGSVLSECIGNGAGPSQQVHGFYENEYETYDSTVFYTYPSLSGCTAGKTNMNIYFTENFSIHINELPPDDGMYQFTGNGPCSGFGATVYMPDGQYHYAISGYLIKSPGNNLEFEVEFDGNDGNLHRITGEGTYLVTEY